LSTAAEGVSAAHCRNCGAYLGDPPGKFCLNCGQDTANHPPTFWEFVHEFVTHYVALEGKLWKTLWLLFFKPAELTREYRAGRKFRYISPLRLYITASFLFFLMVKVAGWGSIVNINMAGDEKENVVVRVGPKGLSAVDRAIHADVEKAKADVAAAVGEAKTELSKALRDGKRDVDGVKETSPSAPVNASNVADSTDPAASATAPAQAGAEESDKRISKTANVKLECAPDERVCRWFETRLKHKWEGRSQRDVLTELYAGAMSNIPYALFMLLPLFAVMTKLVYFNRRMYFGEHMVYALHVHAFTFFVLLLIALVPDAISGLIFFAAMVYYLIAMQRFFGGRWWANLLRYAVIGNLYPLLLALVATLVLLLVIVV
jgi:Protein of unknown function (DUF3667)